MMGNKQLKQKVLEQPKKFYKTDRKLNTKSLHLHGPSQIIYINEQLYLFVKAKEVRNVGFKFICWKNNKIIVRRTDDHVVVIIHNEEDIWILRIKN